MIALPRVIGHRGAAALAPENTLAGFRRAAAEGATWVEFDTRLAADGPVVLHDDTLERTTTGQGPARALPLAELAALDAGARFGVAGEPVPSLREAMLELRRLGLGANVELKPDAGTEAELAGAVADLLRETWSQLGDKLLVSSFSRPALAAFQRCAPEIARGLLVGALPVDWEQAARELGCVSIHADYRKVTPPEAAAVKERGFLLAIYTVNLPADARRMLALGADAIITDRPDLMLALD